MGKLLIAGGGFFSVLNPRLTRLKPDCCTAVWICMDLNIEKVCLDMVHPCSEKIRHYINKSTDNKASFFTTGH